MILNFYYAFYFSDIEAHQGLHLFPQCDVMNGIWIWSHIRVLLYITWKGFVTFTVLFMMLTFVIFTLVHSEDAPLHNCMILHVTHNFDQENCCLQSSTFVHKIKWYLLQHWCWILLISVISRLLEAIVAYGFAQYYIYFFIYWFMPSRLNGSPWWIGVRAWGDPGCGGRLPC